MLVFFEVFVETARSSAIFHCTQKLNFSTFSGLFD
ncbi:hypothetical protein T4B_7912 [Trichinella pseudospiralis]|uniref:Uncharacterized protein n=1 Tax=Trichinella pseudospiralis TaxID=6337 RepID=A0A0V1G1B3_TRIPS|nr:hypothetical protein T4B_7912 [Trichinella pseudospiralis]